MPEDREEKIFYELEDGTPIRVGDQIRALYDHECWDEGEVLTIGKECFSLYDDDIFFWQSFRTASGAAVRLSDIATPKRDAGTRRDLIEGFEKV